MTHRAFLAFLAVSTLGACERVPRDAAPEPEPTETPATQGSILRDDLEDALPVAEPQLPPLETTVLIDDVGEGLSESIGARLMSIAQSPQVEAGGRITLRAHSDSEGSDTANMDASQARGELVRDFLVENDVPEQQITLIAFGEQNPAEPNARPDGTPSPEGRMLNRRVDIHVASGVREPARPEEEQTEQRTLAEDAARITER